MDPIEIIKSILAVVAAQVPWLASSGAMVAGVILLVSPLIEVVELIASMTASTKDDEIAASIHAWKGKIVGILEVLPHVNLPVAAWITVCLSFLKRAVPAAKSAIAAWRASGPS